MQQHNKKKENEMTDLLDNDNPFNDTLEDIFIDNDLFDNTDNKDKNSSGQYFKGHKNRTRRNYVRATTTSNYTWKHRFEPI